MYIRYITDDPGLKGLVVVGISAEAPTEYEIIQENGGGRDRRKGDGSCEEFPLSLNEWKNVLLKYNLKVGIEVTEEIYDSLFSGAERTRAVRKAADILSRGDKSGGAIKRKLYESGISKESAEHAVKLLEKKGYLDEDSQCRRLAEGLLRTKHYGRGRIVSYLISHGYSADKAKAAVSTLEEEDLRDALRYNISKKVTSAAELQKAVASIARLGFSPGEIVSEIRRMSKE